ncbi:MAG: MotA/TolQ/ExbB proton channel family protein [gamma proteobacterium symbiont of Bathyaustriella thionipta]|nr:MotA/TolQ/ExbB proton channel family protein [gamma proteobacterium symbiont of Bathyaustriella thionipta]
MKAFFAQLIVVSSLLVGSSGMAAELDNLLQRVRAEGQAMSRLEQQREKRFLADKQQQAQKLADAEKTLQKLQADNRLLHTEQQQNQQELQALQQDIDEQSQDLQALFQAARQAASELDSILHTSLVSAQFPQREQDLQALLDDSQPATLSDLQHLWYLLLQETIESGKISRFSSPVIMPDGHQQTVPLIRLGSFSITHNGNFLRFDRQHLYQPSRQPDASVVQIARSFGEQQQGMAEAVIDPGRGAALEILSHTPTLLQRIRQGGIIGYIILLLGSIGLLTGLWRLLDTTLIARRMRRQLRNPSQPRNDNPLGRVLLAGQHLREQDPEHLELHLQEAALREIPRLTLAQGFLKLLAAVAPLLGLLGTVTGMILTFQAITLAGGANSSLMAHGIGQALVTTVLGLSSAIPILFLHNLLVARSRSLIQILDQETAGLIAQGGAS